MTTAPPEAIAAIVGGYHGAPFDVLGQHPLADGGRVVRTFQPQASAVSVLSGGERRPMEAASADGFFELTFPEAEEPFAYQLAIALPSGQTYVADDPYRFGPVLTEYDLYLFGEGNHFQLYEKLGAHPIEHEGAAGVSFAVWAPNALRVSVVGNFNQWDGRRLPMRPRGATGLWELFLPGLRPGDMYKFEVKSRFNDYQVVKSDPYGFAMELRPGTALGIGIAQVASLIPGVSRSGATIMGALALGLSRSAAAEFSFILAVPVMLAATLFELAGSPQALSADRLPVLVVGFLTAFVSALFVVRAFLRFVSLHTFAAFAWYRIVFGLLLLAWYLG